jgi:hypothetical protein
LRAAGCRERPRRLAISSGDFRPKRQLNKALISKQDFQYRGLNGSCSSTPWTSRHSSRTIVQCPLNGQTPFWSSDRHIRVPFFGRRPRMLIFSISPRQQNTDAAIGRGMKQVSFLQGHYCHPAAARLTWEQAQSGRAAHLFAVESGDDAGRAAPGGPASDGIIG